MAGASVLLYNFTDKERADKVKFIFVLMGIRIRTVAKEDYLKPIGALAGIKEVPAKESIYEGEGFPDEMLVINHFTDMQMNQMLAYMKKESIRVDLKAAVTDTNQYWNSIELHDEIQKEHEAMKQMKKDK